MTAQPNYLPDVKQQYEDYPYPMRDPNEEKQRLIGPILECFEYLNHYGFGGKRNFQKDFRALVAGGGTGDAVIFLAEQLRDSDAEIVYIDLSQASMNVAKERAKVRGLDNIEWHQASLLDLPTLGFGTFDYINCSGVLHHLKDPDAGLAALKSVLKDDGVMGLMVYGQYGRTGVYQMQELMQLIGADDPIEQRITDCKTILQRLPKTHWFNHNRHICGDLRYGDIGIYDLFLHSQDRAYTVPELYSYVEQQGLTMLKILEPHCYNPACHINNPSLLDKINNKDEKTRYAIGELLTGIAFKHTFYVSKMPKEIPSVDDLDMVPCLPINRPLTDYQQIYQLSQESNHNLVFRTKDVKVGVPNSPELTAYLQYMDGNHSLGEIYDHATKKSNFERSVLQSTFSAFFNALAEYEFIFLRHKDIPPYQTMQEMEDRL